MRKKKNPKHPPKDKLRAKRREAKARRKYKLNKNREKFIERNAVR